MADYQVRRRMYTGGTKTSETLLGQPETRCLATKRMIAQAAADFSDLGYEYVCDSLNVSPDTKINTQDPNSNKSRNYVVVQV